MATQRTRTLRSVFLPASAAAAAGYFGFGAACGAARRLLAWITGARAPRLGSSGLLSNAPDVLGLLFSVFASNTFTALYEQQEAAHLAVYAEVSCARSLLEQIILVLGGPREPRCRAALEAFGRYLADLEAEVGCPRRGPAARLGLGAPVADSPRRFPGEFPDPLEALLYASSVGRPSAHVYETVKDLRAARARRLGAPGPALQRKLPGLQFGLLYALAAAILSSFVLGVAGYAPGQSVVFEAHGFGVLAFALVACLRVLQDIWSPTSGAYSVSAVLGTMTAGLEDELAELAREARRYEDAPR